MIYFMSFITSAFSSIAAWLVQKGITRTIIFVSLKSVTIVIFGIFISAIYYFFSFITNIITMITDLANSFNNNINPVFVGDNDAISLFFGFMDASGIGIAFITVFNLYITIMFIKLTLYLYKTFSTFAFAAYHLYSDIIKSVLK